jgi:WD40 repeat protein
MLEIFKSLDLPESVRSLAFTPDGSTLAAAGGDTQDFVIHIWDVASGEEISTLTGHGGIVWNVTFSPDGQILASVSSDGTAKIWDWRSGDLLKTLDFPDQVGSVSFSPDGQTLAVGGLDDLQSLHAAIWIFSTGSWQPLLKIPEYVNITALSYSPNGRWLVGGGASRNVQVWRTSDGTSIFTLNHAHQVLDAAISPDSSTAATATCGITLNDQCTEGSVWLWDLSTGKLINRLADFPDVVESVTFSVDGSSLIATSRDGTLRVYATSNYEPQFEADPPGGNGVTALSPDGGLLATGGANGDVRLWKIVYRP